MRLAASSGMEVSWLSTSAASLKSDASSTNVAVAMASPAANQAVGCVGGTFRGARLFAGVARVVVGLAGVVTAPDLVETILG